MSVCIPYWDRQGALDRLLGNYGRLYYDMPLEFSICDDGTPTPAVATPQSPNHVVVITRLPPKARPLNPCVPINRAVAAARGQLIVLTSPEIMHPLPILPEMLAALTHELSYVMAPCWDKRRGWLAGPSTVYGSGGRKPVPPGGHFHFCVAFSIKLWERAGGFDEDYRNGQACDDNDWLWRLAAVGARFRTTECRTLHQDASRLAWGLPHNGPLFDEKWPAERRVAIAAGSMDLAREP